MAAAASAQRTRHCGGPPLQSLPPNHARDLPHLALESFLMRALSAVHSAMQSRQLQSIINSADTVQQDMTSILLSGLVIITYACPPESVSSPLVYSSAPASGRLAAGQRQARPDTWHCLWHFLTSPS